MARKGINTYQYGNTVRFEVDFFDFDGQPIDPDMTKIIIYNYKYEIIFQETLGVNNRTGVGRYYYDYITEEKEQKLYYEWYGEINGKPALKRGDFMTKFI